MKKNLIKLILVFFVIISFEAFGAEHAKKERIDIVKNNHRKLKIIMLDGKIFDIQKTQSDITIVNLWAYWCGICKSELKELDKINIKYRDKKIEIIGISIDDKQKIEKIQKITKNLSFRNAVFEDAIEIDIARPKSIPETYVFNSKHELVAVFKGETDEGEIEKMVKKNIK